MVFVCYWLGCWGFVGVVLLVVLVSVYWCWWWVVWSWLWVISFILCVSLLWFRYYWFVMFRCRWVVRIGMCWVWLGVVGVDWNVGSRKWVILVVWLLWYWFCVLLLIVFSCGRWFFLCLFGIWSLVVVNWCVVDWECCLV